MSLNKLSKAIYFAGRITRDVNSVDQSIRKGSAMPLVKRFGNKLIGRLLGKAWLK